MSVQTRWERSLLTLNCSIIGPSCLLYYSTLDVHPLDLSWPICPTRSKIFPSAPIDLLDCRVGLYLCCWCRLTCLKASRNLDRKVPANLEKTETDPDFSASSQSAPAKIHCFFFASLATTSLARLILDQFTERQR